MTPDTCSFGHLFSTLIYGSDLFTLLSKLARLHWQCLVTRQLNVYLDKWPRGEYGISEKCLATKSEKHLPPKLVCILGHGLAPIAPHVNTNHCWLTIFHLSTFLFHNFSKNMLQANFANFSFDGSNLTCSRSLLDLGSAKPNERIIACRAWPSLLLASHRSISPQVHIFSLKD